MPLDCTRPPLPALGRAGLAVRLGITGHQDLPSAAVPWIEKSLQRLVDQHAPLVGLTSLAKGADQLFARCVLDAGQTLEVVVPCHDYLDAFAPEDREAYLVLRELASRVTTLPYGLPSEEAFLGAGEYLASHVDHLVAVWDGKSAQGRGGTADIVAYARARHLPVTVVWPLGVRRG